MKTPDPSRAAPVLAALILAATAAGARAETSSGGRFELDAAVVGTGGTVASGGRFRVEATVDAPVSVPGGAGRFALDGGLWSPVTVEQTPDAPLLGIELLGGGRVRLSWAAQPPGFVLHGSPDPTAGAKSWRAVESPPEESGGVFSVVLLPSEPFRSYRLQK